MGAKHYGRRRGPGGTATVREDRGQRGVRGDPDQPEHHDSRGRRVFFVTGLDSRADSHTRTELDGPSARWNPSSTCEEAVHDPVEPGEAAAARHEDDEECAQLHQVLVHDQVAALGRERVEVAYEGGVGK